MIDNEQFVDEEKITDASPRKKTPTVSVFKIRVDMQYGEVLKTTRI